MIYHAQGALKFKSKRTGITYYYSACGISDIGGAIIGYGDLVTCKRCLAALAKQEKTRQNAPRCA